MTIFQIFNEPVDQILAELAQAIKTYWSLVMCKDCLVEVDPDISEEINAGILTSLLLLLLLIDMTIL